MIDLNNFNNLKGYIYCYTNILNGKKYARTNDRA